MSLPSLVAPAALPGQGAAYEMWEVAVAGGGGWEEHLVDLTTHLAGEVEGVELGGVFASTFGPLQTGVVLWRHGDLDSAPQLQARLASSDMGKSKPHSSLTLSGKAFLKKVTTKKSKILAPCVFSPWQ